MTPTWTKLTSTVPPQWLEAAWTQTASAHATRGLVSQWYGRLLNAYCAPHRHYHNLEHVRQVLSAGQAFALSPDQQICFDLAAWFHDCVYDSRRRDNERRSADTARLAMNELSVPHGPSQTVLDLIHLTETHDDPGDTLGRAFIDSDLLIFAAPRVIYAEYAQAIRREFEWVPPERFRAGRQKVLDHFLHRPRIFWTATLEEMLGQAARENLAWEISSL